MFISLTSAGPKREEIVININHIKLFKNWASRDDDGNIKNFTVLSGLNETSITVREDVDEVLEKISQAQSPK